MSQRDYVTQQVDVHITLEFLRTSDGLRVLGMSIITNYLHYYSCFFWGGHIMYIVNHESKTKTHRRITAA
jgi:hypothetical protein